MWIDQRQLALTHHPPLQLPRLHRSRIGHPSHLQALQVQVRHIQTLTPAWYYETSKHPVLYGRLYGNGTTGSSGPETCPQNQGHFECSRQQVRVLEPGLEGNIALLAFLSRCRLGSELPKMAQ